MHAMARVRCGFVRRGPGAEAVGDFGLLGQGDADTGGHHDIGNIRRAGAAGRHAEGRGYGLVIFSAVLLAVIGFFNLLDGIAAIANSHIFTSNAVYVVGDLRAWGWVMTIFGAVQLLAALGVWGGGRAQPTGSPAA